MEDKCNQVIALHLAGKSQAEIIKELKHLEVHRKFVYRTIKRYNETGSTKKRHGGGAGRTANTPEIAEQIKNELEKNPSISTRQIAQKIGVSFSSIQRIMKNELNLRAYKLEKTDKGETLTPLHLNDDAYPENKHSVFVAPELTDPSKVELLHFPNNAVRINNDVSFVIKKNGVKGNFEVKLENPSGVSSVVPLTASCPERLKVNFNLDQAGLYKVHIKCNSVALPRSPFIIVSICGEAEPTKNEVKLPTFVSDASKVQARGLGLTSISLEEKNEFTVDGSKAGNNILFVGIFGPNGQCDEVVIKHLGKNVYKVTYQVQDSGNYIMAAKWGDDHIPGSPFSLSTF